MTGIEFPNQRASRRGMLWHNTGQIVTFYKKKLIMSNKVSAGKKARQVIRSTCHLSSVDQFTILVVSFIAFIAYENVIRRVSARLI